WRYRSPAVPSRSAERRRSGAGGEIDGRHRLDAGLVVTVEAARMRAVEVDHPDRLAPAQQRHHELGPGGGVAGDMPGKGEDIVDEDRGRPAHGRAADAAADGDPDAGRLALE